MLTKHSQFQASFNFIVNDVYQISPIFSQITFFQIPPAAAPVYLEYHVLFFFSALPSLFDTLN